MYHDVITRVGQEARQWYSCLCASHDSRQWTPLRLTTLKRMFERLYRLSPVHREVLNLEQAMIGMCEAMVLRTRVSHHNTFSLT